MQAFLKTITPDHLGFLIQGVQLGDTVFLLKQAPLQGVNFRSLAIGSAIAQSSNVELSVPFGIGDLDELHQIHFLCLSPDGALQIVKPDMLKFQAAPRVLYTGTAFKRAEQAKKIAAITIVFNEDFILPKWCQYYGGLFGFANLFVIDDGSDNNPRQYLNPDVNVIRMPRTSFDSWRLARSLSELQRLLLETYELVLVLDSDEFIVTDLPGCGNLRDHLVQKHPEASGRVRPIGWDLVHLRREEPDLTDLDLILRQRRFLLRNHRFDKPCITSEETSWFPGNHNCYEPSTKDEHLHLIHLRWFDYRFAVAKGLRYTATDWSKIDLAIGFSHHQRMTIDQIDAKFVEFAHQYDEGLKESQKARILPNHWLNQLMI